MNKEEKIDIIIVNLLKNLLLIEDNDVLLEMYKDMQSKEYSEKEKLFLELNTQFEEQKSLLINMDRKVDIFRNKIKETNEKFSIKI